MLMQGVQGNTMEHLPDSSAGGLQAAFLGTSAADSEKAEQWHVPEISCQLKAQ